MQSTDQHLWISWEDYHRAIEALALKVHQSGWQFDLILCLARGGLRPGDIFSRIFNVPLAILSTSSYREQAGTIQGQLDIAKHITVIKGRMEGRVLLLDDLVDSGITLQQVQNHLTLHFKEIAEVKTAVIWYKDCSIVTPNFYVEHLKTNPWIHQPFEIYDGLTAEKLEAKINAGSV